MPGPSCPPPALQFLTLTPPVLPPVSLFPLAEAKDGTPRRRCSGSSALGWRKAIQQVPQLAINLAKPTQEGEELILKESNN